MKRNLAALTTVAALLVGVGLPYVASAQLPVQQPQAITCPAGGAQPSTSSFVEDVTVFGGHSLVTPFNTGFGGLGTGFGFGTFGTGFPGFINPGFAVASVVTTTENFQGVRGLTQTLISDGFNTPIATIGVPDYLMQAYGGNITAIQRDLAAGFLKCRTS